MAIFKKKTEAKPAASLAVSKPKTGNKSKTGNAYRILLGPVISEKATIAAAHNKYVFLVSPKANKVEIKKAIQEIYGVMPQAVNIINYAGKLVRTGRNIGRRVSTKNAIITLKKGDTIKLYEGT